MRSFSQQWSWDKEISARTVFLLYMGGCQNYGPFLGTLNIRCRIIIGTQKKTIILTTTHIALALFRSTSDCAAVWEGRKLETSWLACTPGIVMYGGSYTNRDRGLLYRSNYAVILSLRTPQQGYKFYGNPI